MFLKIGNNFYNGFLKNRIKFCLKIITKNRIKIITEKKCIRFFKSILAESIHWFRFCQRIDFHDRIQNRFKNQFF